MAKPTVPPKLLSEPQPKPLIGPQLRERRRQLGLSIDDLAGRVGLTKGHLSSIERDLASPSVASLVAICNALGMPVGALFEGTETAVVRRAKRRRIEFGGKGLHDYLLSPSTRSRIQVVWSEMGPGGSGGDELYAIPAEEEFVMVIEGRLVMTVAGQETLLEEGDAMTFDPRRPHTFSNPSKSARTVALFAFTPPLY
ncbi:XRE family transcriptional regulator [Dongia mobilis]|uniref:XRE family transcriptional regulator n=1 Tax=Dongia mobilis TaxID=578943 RepID=A0A4R6WQA2_9PROT|nr:cupin domain-containing protein [Dongia mobilis]TDQ80453.1 XRE family transcriptional regulator [Dongia mobilis]